MQLDEYTLHLMFIVKVPKGLMISGNRRVCTTYQYCFVLKNISVFSQRQCCLII
jgi:hypothetical protein